MPTLNGPRVEAEEVGVFATVEHLELLHGKAVTSLYLSSDFRLRQPWEGVVDCAEGEWLPAGEAHPGFQSPFGAAADAADVCALVDRKYLGIDLHQFYVAHRDDVRDEDHPRRGAKM